jgi:hypothetical protein
MAEALVSKHFKVFDFEEMTVSEFASLYRKAVWIEQNHWKNEADIQVAILKNLLEAFSKMLS